MWYKVHNHIHCVSCLTFELSTLYSASVFGVSAESMQLSFDSKGNSVPTILLLMQERLYSQGGLKVQDFVGYQYSFVCICDFLLFPYYCSYTSFETFAGRRNIPYKPGEQQRGVCEKPVEQRHCA